MKKLILVLPLFFSTNFVEAQSLPKENSSPGKKPLTKDNTAIQPGYNLDKTKEWNNKQSTEKKELMYPPHKEALEFPQPKSSPIGGETGGTIPIKPKPKPIPDSQTKPTSSPIGGETGGTITTKPKAKPVTDSIPKPLPKSPKSSN